MRALSSPILHPPPIPPSHTTLHLPQEVRTPPCCSTLPQPTPGHTIYALQPRRIAAYLCNACPPLMQRLPSNLPTPTPMPMPMQKVAPNHHDSVRPTTPHATNNANPRTPAGRDKPPLRAVLLVRSIYLFSLSDSPGSSGSAASAGSAGSAASAAAGSTGSASSAASAGSADSVD